MWSLPLAWRSGATSSLSTPEREAAFRKHSAAQGVQDVRRFTLVLTVFNLLFWTTDWWVFRATPSLIGVFVSMRLSLVVLALATLLSLRIWPRFLWFISGVAWLLCCAIVAWGMSKLGGPGSAWFHFLHPFLLAPLLIWLPRWLRVLFTVLLGGGTLAVFFGTTPCHLADPLTPTSLAFFSFLCALSALLGAQIDRSRLELFLLQTALQEERTNLTKIVAEQTAELRALACHLDELQENERAHLARELHDESGQTLTAIRYVLRAGLARFAQEPASARPLLVQLPRLIEQLTNQLRAVLTSLRPGHLAELGLEPSISQLLLETEKTTGIRCDLRSNTLPGDLPPAALLVAFRGVQEAVTNAVKHASPSKIQVTLVFQNDELQVRVEDDGSGIDPTRRSAKSMGLLGLRERTASLGGIFLVESTPGYGTSISLTIPKNPPEQRVILPPAREPRTLSSRASNSSFFQPDPPAIPPWWAALTFGRAFISSGGFDEISLVVAARVALFPGPRMRRRQRRSRGDWRRDHRRERWKRWLDGRRPRRDSTSWRRPGRRGWNLEWRRKPARR